MHDFPVYLEAAATPPRTKKTNYPDLFASRMAGRVKHSLGEPFGLEKFGVNLTTLKPRGISALRHAHTKQDEFVYILLGCPTLVTDAGRAELAPGHCAGFRAGAGDGHCLVNETQEDVVYLEVGNRTPGDGVTCPDEDLVAELFDGGWRFTRKDGTPY